MLSLITFDFNTVEPSWLQGSHSAKRVKIMFAYLFNIHYFVRKYRIKRTREFGRGRSMFFVVSFVYFGGILNIY